MRVRQLKSRTLLAAVVTGVTDGLFATVQTILNGSTVTRLWQGVAATVIGAKAFDAGASTALIGLAMHFGVALAWSLVFALMVSQFDAIRRALGKPGGPIAIASIYGPFIWMVMSLGVIPQLTGRPPVITSRWWVQLIGHIPFVALPIVTIIGLPFRPAPASATAVRRVS